MGWILPKPRSNSPVETGGIFFSSKINGGYEALPNISTYMTMYSYDEMRNHPTIRAGLEQIKAPIKSVDYFISGKDENKTKIIETNIRAIFPQLITDILTGMDYGYSPFQRVWEVRGGQAVLTLMNCLKPHFTTILVDDKGQFNGLKSSYYSGVNKGNGKSNDTVIEREYSCVFSYNKEWNNYYGVSRLRAARFPYVVQKYIMEMCNIFYESFADPRYAIYVPEGKTMGGDGKSIDNISYVSEKINKLHGGGAKHIVLPAKKDGDAQYKAEVLESSKEGQDYINYLKYLDSSMLNAVCIPQDMVNANERGSGAKQGAILGQFAFQFDSDLGQIADFINKEIIDYIVMYNFGVKEVGNYKWEYSPMTKKDTEMTRNLVLELARISKLEPNYEWLSRNLGMPLIKTEPPVAAPVKQFSKCNHREHTHMEAPARELTTFEKRVDYKKVLALFESADSFKNSLDAIIDDMKVKYLADARKLISAGDIEGLNKLELAYKDKYAKLYTKNSMNIFDEAFNQVRDELKLGDAKKDAEAVAGMKSRAKNIAGMQIDDMEKEVRNTALTAVSTGAAFGDAENAIKNVFTKNKDSVGVGVEVTIQEFLDEGRKQGAEDPNVELAQWSAVLDDRTCPICEEFDGNMVVSVDSAEYSKYSPGSMHFNCRCIWVYILKGEQDKPAINVPEVNDTDKKRYTRWI